MNDTEYDARVDAIFMQLEEALDECEVDIDYESAGGILTLIFPNQTKIILNKQPPLHQIWVATKYNGHHSILSVSNGLTSALMRNSGPSLTKLRLNKPNSRSNCLHNEVNHDRQTPFC